MKLRIWLAENWDMVFLVGGTVLLIGLLYWVVTR